MNPRPTRRGPRRLLGVLVRALLLLLLLAFLGFAFLAWQVDRLGREDQARPADVIVVLGARVNTDGSPGSDLTSRTYHAVDLWKQGIAPYIICTGGFRDEPLSAASVCKRFAASLDVPADRVYLADGSTNTIEDAQVTKQVMEHQGWQSAVLVSHPLHLFRARWLFHREGVAAVASPTTTDTHRIFPPLRAWYDLREAGSIVVTALDGWAIIPERWVAKLQTWAYALP